MRSTGEPTVGTAPEASKRTMVANCLHFENVSMSCSDVSCSVTICRENIGRLRSMLGMQTLTAVLMDDAALDMDGRISSIMTAFLSWPLSTFSRSSETAISPISFMFNSVRRAAGIEDEEFDCERGRAGIDMPPGVINEDMGMVMDRLVLCEGILGRDPVRSEADDILEPGYGAHAPPGPVLVGRARGCESWIGVLGGS